MSLFSVKMLGMDNVGTAGFGGAFLPHLSCVGKNSHVLCHQLLSYHPYQVSARDG